MVIIKYLKRKTDPQIIGGIENLFKKYYLESVEKVCEDCEIYFSQQHNERDPTKFNVQIHVDNLEQYKRICQILRTQPSFKFEIQGFPI